MNTKHTLGPWYATNAAGDAQGLVIAETTGANIAVTYRPEDAALVAAAPDMLAALRDAYAHITLLGSGEQPPLSNAEMCNVLGDALAKATGGWK